MPKKILILAGEASGDLQGAFLINSLKKIRNDFEVFGAGGPNLAAAGADIAYDISSLGVVGPWNAVQKLPIMLRMYYDMRKRMVEYKPDLVIMIDSPAMNMRMGK
ncbi:MAG: lipid-A-disaccharide synthase, partial [bacterium]|nr:lipid-A-disaccharide synthase [bacterium]